MRAGAVLDPCTMLLSSMNR